MGNQPDSNHSRHTQKANLRKRGNYYETAAASFLTKQGYRILTRNYRCRMGEVDLIAEEDGYLVFVEVKFRSSTTAGQPEQAVTVQKRHRIRNVARWYLMAEGYPADTPVRFDVVSICGSTIRLYKHAFWADGTI